MRKREQGSRLLQGIEGRSLTPRWLQPFILVKTTLMSSGAYTAPVLPLSLQHGLHVAPRGAQAL